MASTLLLTIQNDMKNAMRAKDAELLGTIRLLLAAIKQREIDERITLDETQILAVIDKMIKQRQEAIIQYQNGNRQDLAQKELAEISVLKKYLPQALTPIEIKQMIDKTIATQQAKSLKDMGGIMAILKPKMQGRADMSKVSAEVKKILESNN